MAFKRNSIQSSSNRENQSKKAKTVESINYFHKTLQEGGLTLKRPPEKCVVTQEGIHIIRNIKKALEKHFDYPRNISELFIILEKECLDLDIFKHYLYPNIVMITENDEEHLLNDSVIKILLSIPILQCKLIDYIFEKAIDLAAQSNCGSWIQMILKCFSSLDSIIDGDKITTHLINLLEISTEKLVRLEIITAIPDIINDQQHNNMATEMSRILNDDHDLIPAILDCLTYLCLSDEQYEQLQKKTINILSGLSKCNVFPNFVKFLLIPGRLNDNAYLEAVQGLRDGIGWPTSIVTPQEIASSQVLTATAIRNSIVSSKVISGAWLKVISMCKVHTEHKPIDFIIILVLYSTSEERKRQVENVIRKQIKLNILKEELMDETFNKFKPLLKEYLKSLIELTNTLLKTQGDPLIQSLALHIYTLMFANLDDCCQTILAELLQLGLDSKQCMMNILLILNNVATKDVSLLKAQSVQMLTLLDRMDDNTPISEIKAVMNLLSALAYGYENSLIRDDMHMIIRKELSSSNLRIKTQGILAGIHAIKYLMATHEENETTTHVSNNESSDSPSHLPEGSLREAAQIVELISRSTQQFPMIIEIFYDELSQIISSASFINKHFLSWLTEAVTNDLEQNFIVSTIEEKHIGELKLTMQYCLNEESEMENIIAINVAGLTLQPKAEINIAILSPLFQLVQILHSKQDGNLSSIDALLGCPIVMPVFDIDAIQDIDQISVTKIIDCLIHTVNWFRELLNAFSLHKGNALKAITLERLAQIDELQSLIADILLKTKVSYKAPSYVINIDKYRRECIMEKKANMLQGSKNKIQKKTIQDETVLPETTRTQGTQNNNIFSKGTINGLHNICFRPLNLNLLNLLNNDLSDDNETRRELKVKTLTFLLKCINDNLENVMISKIKKRTFLSKQEHIIYDSKKGEECAKSVSKILQKMMDHLHYITLKIEKYSSENVSNENTLVLYTSEILDYICCLEHVYNMFTIYLKWIGFRNCHGGLFKSSLRTIARNENANVSLKDLLLTITEDLQKHQKYCLQLSTAVSLVDLLQTIQSYTDNKNILGILRNMAHNFLSQQWKTPEGILEKGLAYNQCVDRLASIYLINNEILELKQLILRLTHDIKLLKSTKDSLNCLKCINKSNFSILYKNIGTAIHEAIKSNLNYRMTNSEHVNLWKDVANILKYMSDIAKSLDNRNNLSAFFKKTLPVLKLFLSHGVPILEIQLKHETEDILEILKTLQLSTRFLQSLCCHSRLKKDKALMCKVPYARQLLETLIYKVKAALAANNCSEAFWMGNLKNKDIHGDIIVSQTSTDEEPLEDCDDQLPGDDDSDEIDELLNPDSRSISDIV